MASPEVHTGAAGELALTTPVALLVFNRPEPTERVFAAIRAARPRRLLVVADGPRPDRPGEPERCARVREIVDAVDWPCEVERNCSPVNLGCRARVASGIDWIFARAEEAIVLEDDCVPDPTFFPFCEEMLSRYRHDERVMMVSGTNLLGEWKSASQSYHFSNYGGIWGWASWARAWRHFDVEMRLWRDPEVRQRVRDVLADDRQFAARAAAFDAVSDGRIDTWDYQWGFARHHQSGLSVVPAVNLVTNVGFGAEATHTTDPASAGSGLATTPCRFPLKINPFVAVDRGYDDAFAEKAVLAGGKRRRRGVKDLIGRLMGLEARR